MNPPTDINIVIPAAIAALPGLNLSERVALAHIAKRPGCSNASLAKLLGVSMRGAEDLLRRLRDNGLIQAFGKGRARQHVLLFPVEHPTLCGKSDDGKSHTKCEVKPPALAVIKPEPSTHEFMVSRLACFENCLECGEYDCAMKHLEAIRERLEGDANTVPDLKTRLLASLKKLENQCFAYGVTAKLADGRPADEQRDIALKVCRASTEQLALFRERVQSAASVPTWKTAVCLIDG
jgi:hypothetical protein